MGKQNIFINISVNNYMFLKCAIFIILLSNVKRQFFAFLIIHLQNTVVFIQTCLVILKRLYQNVNQKNFFRRKDYH